MYVGVMAHIKIEISGDPQEIKELLEGGDALRTLCRNEVDRFDLYLRNKVGGEYKDGIVRFERFAIEGFLYQKIRGHIDEAVPLDDIS